MKPHSECWRVERVAFYCICTVDNIERTDLYGHYSMTCILFIFVSHIDANCVCTITLQCALMSWLLDRFNEMYVSIILLIFPIRSVQTCLSNSERFNTGKCCAALASAWCWQWWQCLSSEISIYESKIVLNLLIFDTKFHLSPDIWIYRLENSLDSFGSLLRMR